MQGSLINYQISWVIEPGLKTFCDNTPVSFILQVWNHCHHLTEGKFLTVINQYIFMVSHGCKSEVTSGFLYKLLKYEGGACLLWSEYFLFASRKTTDVLRSSVHFTLVSEKPIDLSNLISRFLLYKQRLSNFFVIWVQFYLLRTGIVCHTFPPPPYCTSSSIQSLVNFLSKAPSPLKEENAFTFSNLGR